MNNKNRFYDPFSTINNTNGLVHNVDKDNPSSIPSANKTAQKVYLIRQDINEKIIIKKSNYKLGKNSAICNYVITDNKTISRVHAEILLKNGQAYIVDKNSTNKTFLNGKAILPEEAVLINNGDEIKLANLIFAVSIE